MHERGGVPQLDIYPISAPALLKEPLQLCLNNSQEPCAWVDADLGVLWIESVQILHLKVGCLNFGPLRGSAIYPIVILNKTDLQQKYAMLDAVLLLLSVKNHRINCPRPEQDQTGPKSKQSTFKCNICSNFMNRT